MLSKHCNRVPIVEDAKPSGVVIRCPVCFETVRVTGIKELALYKASKIWNNEAWKRGRK